MSDRTCVVDGCERDEFVKSRQLCNAHYQRLMKTGTTDLPVRQGDLPCEMDGCEKPRHARGLCSTHQSKIRRKGSPAGPVRAWLPVADRFWALVTKTETCWLFANVQSNGYGSLSGAVTNGRSNLAHRVAYELLIGPIPEGLQLDHLCRVRNCVNPEHLEPVTPWENTMRSTSISAVNARKTECLRGHPFSDENTYYSKDGRRYCIACRDARAREYYARKITTEGWWLCDPMHYCPAGRRS